MDEDLIIDKPVSPPPADVAPFREEIAEGYYGFNLPHELTQVKLAQVKDFVQESLQLFTSLTK